MSDRRDLIRTQRGAVSTGRKSSLCNSRSSGTISIAVSGGVVSFRGRIDWFCERREAFRDVVLHGWCCQSSSRIALTIRIGPWVWWAVRSAAVPRVKMSCRSETGWQGLNQLRGYYPADGCHYLQSPWLAHLPTTLLASPLSSLFFLPFIFSSGHQ